MGCVFVSRDAEEEGGGEEGVGWLTGLLCILWSSDGAGRV